MDCLPRRAHLIASRDSNQCSAISEDRNSPLMENIYRDRQLKKEFRTYTLMDHIDDFNFRL